METRNVPLQILTYGLSDPGLVRKNNEDVWGCLPEHHIYVLADGMGGHQAGEVAAREAVIHLCSLLRAALESGVERDSIQSMVAAIQQAMAATNHFIYELGQTDELLHGMGTTLLCLQFFSGHVIAAHVGDSRIYRLRDQKLQQLTQDHSLLREMIDTGKVSSSQASDSPYKNILTRAIGTSSAVEASFAISVPCENDLYLMCSDGLSDLLSEQEIEVVLNQPLSIEEKVRSLIAAAKHKGGYDNITVVLIEVIGTDAKESIS